MPVYLPVYLIPLVLFKGKAIVKDPTGTLGHTALGVARSSVFLVQHV